MKNYIGNSTLLYTNHGLKYVQDIMKGDLLISENKNEYPCDIKILHGDLIEIDFDNGITEQYSPDQEIKVWTGEKVIWKKVIDLSSDDEIIQCVGYFKNGKQSKIVDYSKVYLNKRYENTETSFEVCSNEFAYLGGLFLGDGHLEFRTLVNGLKKPALVSYCVEPCSLEDVITLFKNLNLRVNVPNTIGKNNKIYKINISNSSWSQCIVDYFGYTTMKHLDTSLLNLWDIEQLRYFIAGLIDSDGTVSKASGRISFSNTNENICKALIVACSAIGIKASFRNRKSKYKGESYPYMEITLWDIPQSIPILNDSKTGTLLKPNQTLYGSWKVTKEFAKIKREVVRQAGYNWKSQMYKTWQNVIEGHCRLSQGVLNKTLNVDKEFPIKSYMNNVKIISKKTLVDKAYFINTKANDFLSINTICKGR